jgi:hypothetical protein
MAGVRFQPRLLLFGRLLGQSAAFQLGLGPGGGVLPGVGFGLGGEPQLAGYFGRGARLGAFGFQDADFELAAGHAAHDVGFVTYLQGADRGLAHALEFGVATVRAG